MDTQTYTFRVSKMQNAPLRVVLVSQSKQVHGDQIARLNSELAQGPLFEDSASAPYDNILVGIQTL